MDMEKAQKAKTRKRKRMRGRRKELLKNQTKLGKKAGV